MILIIAACGDSNTSKPIASSDRSQRMLSYDSMPGTDTTLNFEESTEGTLPGGWSAPTGKWSIVTDENNKVLKQTAVNSGGYFNICVNNNLAYQNFQLQVKLKAVSGRGDQGGGLVWRYLDKDNYYIVRANPLEKNVVLYKVEKGKRKDLPLVGKGRTYGMDAPMESGKWHDLGVNVQGNTYTVSFDGKHLYDVTDNTFTKEGLIGVWTKADAVTLFDEIQVSIK